MHKVKSKNATDGKFYDGNKSTGTKGTQVDADFLNCVQDEIVNAVEASGQALNDNDNAQLKKAIFKISASSHNVISASKTIDSLPYSATSDTGTIPFNLINTDVELKKGDFVDLSVIFESKNTSMTNKAFVNILSSASASGCTSAELAGVQAITFSTNVAGKQSDRYCGIVTEDATRKIASVILGSAISSEEFVIHVEGFVVRSNP